MIIPYQRDAAVAYAHKWAHARNPRYYNFDGIGGDCTNFASQVLFAGSRVMNYASCGWYYTSVKRRAAAWTSVEYLYKFLVNNTGVGPFGSCVEMGQIQLGDLIQFSIKGQRFEHSPVVVAVKKPISAETILVASHSNDVDYRPLSTYKWVRIRFIHIEGVRKW